MKIFSKLLDLLVLLVIILVVVTLVITINVVFGAPVGKAHNNQPKVVGEFTYKNCLNNCGVYYNHYIDSAMVIIKEDCIGDRVCAECLDECAESLRQNNNKVYKYIMERTIREEF